MGNLSNHSPIVSNPQIAIAKDRTSDLDFDRANRQIQVPAVPSKGRYLGATKILAFS
jgi:hypothetical protein